MRFLGLDIGSRRIGVAISDETALIASPYGVISRTSIKNDVQEIITIAVEKRCGAVVLGYPLGLDGKKNSSTRLVDLFYNSLKESFQGEIFFIDERFTTKLAQQALISGNVRRSERKKTVDKVAAALILQSYLDSLR
ncbi:MAG: Holliday junction resolvase RuvX [Deltaproteobacteria bacterium]|nr:Holliday junction resolvase RuvX [Deltaproteobacteria bacterium]